MTFLSRRKFIVSAFKASAFVAVSSSFPYHAKAAKPSSSRDKLFLSLEGNVQKLLSKNMRLDKTNRWGKKQSRLLRNLLEDKNCEHLASNQFSHLSVLEKIDAVNRYVNRVPYISDQQQYQRGDVWADPHHFLENGGDCEDFALAKFSYLAQSDIHPERLFILGLQDKHSPLAHASLAIVDENRLIILDNQRNALYGEDEYIQKFSLAYALNVAGLWKPV